jgi:hypothetical protein
LEISNWEIRAYGKSLIAISIMASLCATLDVEMFLNGFTKAGTIQTSSKCKSSRHALIMLT